MKIVFISLILSVAVFAQDQITVNVAGKSTVYALKPSLVASLQALVVAEKGADKATLYKDAADFIIKELNRGAFEYAAAIYPDATVKAKVDALAAAAADLKAITDSAVKVPPK